jgi:hypothetical protein
MTSDHFFFAALALCTRNGVTVCLPILGGSPGASRTQYGIPRTARGPVVIWFSNN